MTKTATKCVGTWIPVLKIRKTVSTVTPCVPSLVDSCPVDAENDADSDRICGDTTCKDDTVCAVVLFDRLNRSKFAR